MMETEPGHSAKLLDLLERSKAMLAHAEAGDWQRVVAEEEACRQLINTYFSDPSRLTDVNGIGQAIQELLQINDRLQKLAANARDQSKSELSTISEGRKAVNAYAQHTR
jgi:hypothetical protein